MYTYTFGIETIFILLINLRKIGGASYGSDARLLNNVAGIPTVIYGPGNIDQAHSIDEFLDLEQYFNSIKILAISIIKWTMRE